MATKDEHLRLHAVIESGVYSWERYVKAGVEVLDMETGKPVPPDTLIQMAAPFRTAFRDARFIEAGSEMMEMQRLAATNQEE